MTVEELENNAAADAIKNEAAMDIRRILDAAIDKIEELEIEIDEDAILELVTR
jgi:hypothetical protein